MKSKAKKFPKAKNPKAGMSEAQLESRLPPRDTPGLPPPLNVRPPVKSRQPVKESYPDWILTLPDHLDEFGTAIHKERGTCVKLLTEALEEYDDKIYDAVLDATPKEVIAAMKGGRESITSQADAILAIACACAEDHIEAPPTVLDIITGTSAREAGDDINAALCEADSLWQYEFCQTLVHNLTHDAREALLNALLP